MPFPIREVGNSGNRGYPVRLARDGERGYPCEVVTIRGYPVFLTDGSYGYPIRIVAGDHASLGEGGSVGVVGPLVHPNVSHRLSTANAPFFMGWIGADNEQDDFTPVEQTGGTVNALSLMGWVLGISDRLTVSAPDQVENVMFTMGWLAGNLGHTTTVVNFENFALSNDSEYFVFNMGWI